MSVKTYKPPLLLFNGFWQTVVPSLISPYPQPPYIRERFELEDGDFLDLDWLYTNSRKLVVMTHGLEGNSSSFYIKEAANFFASNKYDVLAWNCRSCSGELNRTRKLYHHGDPSDLLRVLRHEKLQNYDAIFLLGVSMGGNISIKLLGTTDIQNELPSLKASIAISVPCDLRGASESLDRPINYFFKRYFTRLLRTKLEKKNEQFPGYANLEIIKTFKKWEEFDEGISAPLFGYEDANAFYHSCSSMNYLDHVNLPLLILNAKNDPVLTPSCTPIEKAESNSFVQCELQRKGGHGGFPLNWKLSSYSSKRALAFFEENR